MQGGSIHVNDIAEDRALLEGATLARAHGIGLGVIFKELAQTLKPFADRFSRPTNALDLFAETLDAETLESV